MGQPRQQSVWSENYHQLGRDKDTQEATPQVAMCHQSCPCAIQLFSYVSFTGSLSLTAVGTNGSSTERDLCLLGLGNDTHYIHYLEIHDTH